MKLEYRRQILERYSDISFHENPSSGSRVVPCRQKHMTKLLVAFSSFANVSKSEETHQKKYLYLSLLMLRQISNICISGIRSKLHSRRRWGQDNCSYLVQNTSYPHIIFENVKTEAAFSLVWVWNLVFRLRDWQRVVFDIIVFMIIFGY
jgi:hypothetical protein